MMYREDGLPAGTVVQGIEIQRLLRADRFVLTYLARDTASGRSLALKEYLPRDWGRRRRNGTVEPQTADTEHFLWGLARFLDEAHLAEQLAERDDDRHLVGLKRVFEDRGTAYVALEYEAVRTLEESTAEGLPEARVREVLSDIEAGLKCMHAAGLYHYDVTPSNVVVRADGKRALMFACGRTRQEMARRCRTAAGVFSPAFAAAEQHDVQEGKDGPWTDIHALGALAYWALSGRAPEGVPEAAGDGPPMIGEVSEAVSSALASALATEGRERPQSLEEWRARLTSPFEEPVPQTVPQPSRMRWAMASAVVVLLGLVGLAAWAVVERQLRKQAEVSWQARESELGDEIEELSTAFATTKSTLENARETIAVLTALLVDQDKPADLEVLRPPECDYCPPVVELWSGTFTMGSDSEDTERPPHSRTIGRFAIGRTEVTQAQYEFFEQDGGGTEAVNRQCRSLAGERRADGAYPVICVRWREAQAYVEWLAEKTGRPYRLPTEAEWEYAARARTTTDWYWGTDEDASCLRANRYSDCDGFPSLTRVESFDPNAFGLFDMAGNVQEWVADCWHNTYEGAPSDGTARMNTSGPCTQGVARGGSYEDSITWLRVSARRPLYRYVISLRTGFRVALSLE